MSVMGEKNHKDHLSYSDIGDFDMGLSSTKHSNKFLQITTLLC